MAELSITIKRNVHAPIEKVFDAWLDPQMLSKFIIPMKGMPEPQVENDPRVGGKFTIIMQAGDKSLPHSGEYMKIDRPNSLIFSWVSDHSIEGSRVSLDFMALDQHTTEVTLTQVKFFDEPAMRDHKGGWNHILETLDKSMAGQGHTVRQ